MKSNSKSSYFVNRLAVKTMGCFLSLENPEWFSLSPTRNKPSLSTNGLSEINLLEEMHSPLCLVSCEKHSRCAIFISVINDSLSSKGVRQPVLRSVLGLQLCMKRLQYTVIRMMRFAFNIFSNINVSVGCTDFIKQHVPFTSGALPFIASHVGHSPLSFSKNDGPYHHCSDCINFSADRPRERRSIEFFDASTVMILLIAVSLIPNLPRTFVMHLAAFVAN